MRHTTWMVWSYPVARACAALVTGLALAALGAACAGEPAGSDPTGPDPATAVSAPRPGTSASTRTYPAEPVAFFRSQAPACRAYAKANRNPQVESARFIRASFVDSLGDGAFLIRDGFGTRLVVRPADRQVLPSSGRDSDEMPAPYARGCPPEVFKGTR